MRQKAGQAIAPFFILGQGRGMQPSDVTVISVCYNSAAVLGAMLQSLPDGVPVVLVDNASQDTDALRALADRNSATLIRNDRNAGFGPACNQGAAAADTPLLLFLNPDTSLAPSAIQHMLQAVENYPDAVAFNPRLVGPSGKPQFKRRSKLITRAQWMARGWPDSDRPVAILSGAALLVRAADFHAVGGFDPNIFLYHEDDDLSLRLQAERGQLMFIRAAEVMHLEGRSNQRSPHSARFKGYQLARSAVYAKRKHGRRWPFLSTLLEALRHLAAPDNLLSARKRAKNVGFFKGVISSLATRP
jgi:GT2 family glycosyltransferase